MNTNRRTMPNLSPDDILAAVKSNPGSTTKSIAEDFGCYQSTINKRVRTLIETGRLVRDGFVLRPAGNTATLTTPRELLSRAWV
jgi:transposase-like protein